VRGTRALPMLCWTLCCLSAVPALHLRCMQTATACVPARIRGRSTHRWRALTSSMIHGPFVTHTVLLDWICPAVTRCCCLFFQLKVHSPPTPAQNEKRAKEGARQKASARARARAIKSERADRSAHESSRAQHPAHPLRSQPAACVGPACRRAQPPLLPGHPRWEPSVAGIPFFRLLVSPRGPAHAATQNSSLHHRLSSHLCARCWGLACVDACTSAGACAPWRLSALPSLRAAAAGGMP